MRFVLMTEPQLGGTYDDLLFAARAAEKAGLYGFARSDHYYWSGGPGLPATDAFTTLGGLARETDRARLTILVSPITFRHPAVMAKAAASIDQMSGGRFDLGLGAGWMEAEHTAFGLPFPPLEERFIRLEESLQYLRAAFTGGTFEGEVYRFDADARPRPNGINLVVGGSGPRRTPTLAGRFADEYNHAATAPELLAPKIELMRAAASVAGRNADDVTVSVMGPAMLAPDNARLSELLHKAATFRNVSVSEIEERWNNARIPYGTPERFSEGLSALAAVGVAKYYFQWVDLPDRAGVEEQVGLAAGLKL